MQIVLENSRHRVYVLLPIYVNFTPKQPNISIYVKKKNNSNSA
jgi:hypothetical protein